MTIISKQQPKLLSADIINKMQRRGSRRGQGFENFIQPSLGQNVCEQKYDMSWDKEVAATSLLVCVVVAVLLYKAQISESEAQGFGFQSGPRGCGPPGFSPSRCPTEAPPAPAPLTAWCVWWTGSWGSGSGSPTASSAGSRRCASRTPWCTAGLCSRGTRSTRSCGSTEWRLT